MTHGSVPVCRSKKTVYKKNYGEKEIHGMVQRGCTHGRCRAAASAHPTIIENNVNRKNFYTWAVLPEKRKDVKNGRWLSATQL